MGAPIHRCRAVKTFLVAGAARRLQLEQFPGYTPDPNPDEGARNLPKRLELANQCSKDVPELQWELDLTIRCIRRRRQVLTACFR